MSYTALHTTAGITGIWFALLTEFQNESILGPVCSNPSPTTSHQFRMVPAAQAIFIAHRLLNESAKFYQYDPTVNSQAVPKMMF